MQCHRAWVDHARAPGNGAAVGINQARARPRSRGRLVVPQRHRSFTHTHRLAAQTHGLDSQARDNAPTALTDGPHAHRHHPHGTSIIPDAHVPSAQLARPFSQLTTRFSPLTAHLSRETDDARTPTGDTDTAPAAPPTTSKHRTASRAISASHAGLPHPSSPPRRTRTVALSFRASITQFPGQELHLC